MGRSHYVLLDGRHLRDKELLVRLVIYLLLDKNIMLDNQCRRARSDDEFSD